MSDRDHEIVYSAGLLLDTNCARYPYAMPFFGHLYTPKTLNLYAVEGGWGNLQSALKLLKCVLFI